jgi:hypothetical protein
MRLPNFSSFMEVNMFSSIQEAELLQYMSIVGDPDYDDIADIEDDYGPDFYDDRDIYDDDDEYDN